MPAVAASASWLEAFHLPMREVRKRYTKSEMAIMSWRSREIGYNMRVNRPEPHHGAVIGEKPTYTGLPPVHSTEQERLLEERLGPLVIRLNEVEDEKIGLDARKLTGDEAMAFLESQGMHIGGRMLG